MANVNKPNCEKCLRVSSLSQHQQDLIMEGLCPDPKKDAENREHCSQIGGRIIPLANKFRNFLGGL
jgi:hypothetical protein